MKINNRVIPIKLMDHQSGDAQGGGLSPACSVARYLEKNHNNIFSINECPLLITSSLPYSYSLKKGTHFPWSEDLRSVDSQCPNGTRMQITKLDDDQVRVEIMQVSESCAWGYKSEYKFDVNKLFQNSGSVNELSVLKRVVEIEGNTDDIDGRAINPKRISVHNWNASCWYYRTKKTMQVPVMGALKEAGIFDLMFQIQPVLLRLLYAKQSKIGDYEGDISLNGDTRKITARRSRYWFYPVINLADFVLKKFGINYDFVFYKVRVEVPSIGFSMVFDHWSIPLTKNPLCNSAVYQSYLIQKFYRDKSSVAKFICPSWASSVEFLIR